MKDHPISVVLIFLVFASSFNHGEKITDWIGKFNERRAAGILAQPRVGRTMGIGTFGRSDGGAIAAAAGLVHYPRVGRSERSSPQTISDNQKYPLQFDGEPPLNFDNHQRNQRSHLRANFEEQFRKHLNENGMWLSMPTSGMIKEQQQRYPHCDNQIDDSSKMERQLQLYYLPRTSGDRIH